MDLGLVMGTRRETAAAAALAGLYLRGRRSSMRSSKDNSVSKIERVRPCVKE